MKQSAFALAAVLWAAPLLSQAEDPHFYIQLDNRSDTNATLNFEADPQKAWLVPALDPNQPLPAHSLSQKYGVMLDITDPAVTFNLVFNGSQACTFTLGFFAPGSPLVTIKGLGCKGGGYDLNNGIMTVFVTHLK